MRAKGGGSSAATCRLLASCPSAFRAMQVRAARVVDLAEGAEAWKRAPESAWYDAPALTARLHALREARLAGDTRACMALVRENLDRGLCGLNTAALYEYCAFGTKALVEEYIREVEAVLWHIATEAASPIATAAKVQVLKWRLTSLSVVVF